MHQKLGLQARLTQRLVLTPSLQQAIKLLPLTTLELAEHLENEVMENPLLEEVPAQEATGEEAQVEAAEEEKKADPLDEIDVEKFFEEYMEDTDYRRTRSVVEIPEMPPSRTPSRSPQTSTTTCCGSSGCRPRTP